MYCGEKNKPQMIAINQKDLNISNKNTPSDKVVTSLLELQFILKGFNCFQTRRKC